MKKLRFTNATFIVCCILLCAVLSSCNNNKEIIDRNSMTSIIKHCKGRAVVISKGYNEGNFEAYRYYLIIRDDSLNVYEYIGAKYDVNVGDTIK